MVARIIAVSVLVYGVVLAANAVGPGSIKLNLERGEKAVEGAMIQLSKVGIYVTGGYRLSAEYGGGFISESDVLDPKVAQWLAVKAKNGFISISDAQGNAVFTNLEEGLYLLMHHAEEGQAAFEPFVMVLPWDGYVWDITASPMTHTQLQTNPDTSDPGYLDQGILGMALSAMGLWGMVITGKQLLRKEDRNR